MILYWRHGNEQSSLRLAGSLVSRVFSQKLGGLSLSSLYRNIGSGLIPEPIRRGGGLYWIERQVDEALINQQQQLA